METLAGAGDFPYSSTSLLFTFRHLLMELNLKGRTALITGGSRGIGYGVAESLAAEGCILHLSSRNAESLEAAKKKLADKYGAKVSVYALDLGKSENMTKLANAAGPVDILVNNAGAIPHGSITAVDEKTWREAWDYGDENRWRELTTGFPFGRLGTVAEIADTVAFLCSNRAGYTTGTVVTIDGGNSLRK
jgi:NAD(P)-dependent dehydrogenase (short-subunit alcohol dehydrogenase family)